MAPPSVHDILRGRHARRQASRRGGGVALDPNSQQQDDEQAHDEPIASASYNVSSTTPSLPSRASQRTYPKSGSLARSVMPEALRDDADKHDDIVATVPNMNHSMLSVLQTLGRTMDYPGRIEDLSSDDEQSKEEARKDTITTTFRFMEKRLKRSRPQPIDEDGEVPTELLADDMYGSQILPRKDTEGSEEAPYLSMMLKGEAEMEASQNLEEAKPVAKDPSTAATLAQRLKEIFKLETPEAVEAEYPCWLLQTVLLAGHLYITSGHFCFYAYLPKNSNVVAKSGHLGKRGRHNPTYRRYYLELKGDALRYYDDPSRIYTPAGQIDLRFGISVTIEPDGRKSREKSSLFKLETKQRTYWFRADSVFAARDWVKHLQRVIFRSHNDGDSVKVCIPIENVIDIEDWKFLDALSDTVKIRSIDASVEQMDGVDAMDEFHFSFFELDGKEAIDKMRASVARVGSTGNDRKERMRTTIFPPGVEPSPHRSSFESDGPRSRGREDIKELDETDSSESRDISASQILSRTDVFRATKHRIRSELDERDDSHASIEARPKPVPIQSSSTSISTFQNIVHAGSAPIRGVSTLAGMIKDRSYKMSSMLANESLGYLEKVSGMWQAPVKHYEPIEGMPPDDDEEQEDIERYSRRFQEHFALPESETLVATYFGNFFRVLPLYGKVYISKNYFCFRSLFPGMRTKLVLPLDKMESAVKVSSIRNPLRYYGMVVTIQGHEEIFFEFADQHARDDCTITLILSIEAIRERDKAVESPRDGDAMAEYEALKSFARRDEAEIELETKDYLTQVRNAGPDAPALLYDSDPSGSSMLNFKPSKPLKITCLTIGSRGDVQPYIALAKGLQADGHTVTIATHDEFGAWIKSHGIGFAPISGDPGELMKLCIEYGTFTLQFLREASSKFRDWIDDLLMTAWDGCQGSDVLIESPSAMAGIHIAEALQIPYFRAFTMPWTRTRAYPHAFAVPEKKMGGTYNFFTYQMIDVVFWRGIANAVNRWRINTLNLGPTSLNQLHVPKVPFLYCFSPAVVPPPLDYSDWIRVTGFWFLDEGDKYQPPEELVRFIAKAKGDGKKLVYVGFGSILVDDPMAMMRMIVDAVRKADVRCILAKGWSERVTSTVATVAGSKDKPQHEVKEVEIPDSILQIKATPHDWLFPQMDCIAHHGGSGTTGASLRAGIPTIAKPFFGDQFFFGRRIEDLGVGICLKKLNSTALGRAIWEACHSGRMIKRAREIGERIRQEDGVAVAVAAIYRDLEYARSLIKRHDDEGGVDVKLRDDVVGDDGEEGERWTWVDVDFEEARRR